MEGSSTPPWALKMLLQTVRSNHHYLKRTFILLILKKEHLFVKLREKTIKVKHISVFPFTEKNKLDCWKKEN